MNQVELYQRVVANREMIELSLAGIKQHDLLLRAHSSCSDNLHNTIGYCLQIRQVKDEHAAKHEVFLRHSDGSIVMHYDQIFYRVAKQDIAEVLATFKIKPEDELEGSINNIEGVSKTGFRPC